MFRRVAIGLLVFGLSGCATQQTQPLAVATQDTASQYREPPAWVPVTTQALQTTKPGVRQVPAQVSNQAIGQQLIATSRAAYPGALPMPV